MKTIVVGHDASEPSQRALARASSLAGAYDAKLVITSVSPVTGRGVHMVDPAPGPGDIPTELAHARTYLQDKDVRARYVAAEGEPARMIASVADEHDADLIVVGTREANVAERIRRPSISRAVASDSRRDVLIVHPDQPPRDRRRP